MVLLTHRSLLFPASPTLSGEGGTHTHTGHRNWAPMEQSIEMQGARAQCWGTSETVSASSQACAPVGSSTELPAPPLTAAQPLPRQPSRGALCSINCDAQAQGTRTAIFSSLHPGRKTNPSHALLIPIKGAAGSLWEFSPPGSQASVDDGPSARKGSRAPTAACASCHCVCPQQAAILGWSCLSQEMTGQSYQRCLSTRLVLLQVTALRYL